MQIITLLKDYYNHIIYYRQPDPYKKYKELGQYCSVISTQGVRRSIALTIGDYPAFCTTATKLLIHSCSVFNTTTA